ncbi:MAG: proline--tRNA ligase, partial [bacterium]|nr:proline--tRNA ligase [bacterium]
RRDKPVKEKAGVPRTEFLENLVATLDEMQENILQRARSYRDEYLREIDTKEEFYAWFTPESKDNPEAHGGFALTHWNGSEAVEEQIKKDLAVTIRCIPNRMDEVAGTCPFTGEPSPRRVVWAKSY